MLLPHMNGTSQEPPVPFKPRTLALPVTVAQRSCQNSEMGILLLEKDRDKVYLVPTEWSQSSSPDLGPAGDRKEMYREVSNGS